MTDDETEIAARLAALDVRVDGHELETRELPGAAFRRLTTVVRLRGGGECGVGEDVGYSAADHEQFVRAELTVPLAGRCSLGRLAERLAAADLFPRPPRWAASRQYRRWAFDSAAVDLALRQAGMSLAAAVGRAPRPVRFVASPSLGLPPTMRRLRERLAGAPGIELKLDVTSRWDDALIDELAATGRVRVVDFKGAYEDTPVDGDASPALHARIAEAFPDAWLEDPSWSDDVRAALDGHLQRVSWDAPIHAVADLDRLPEPPGAINLKPSRSATLIEFLALVGACRARGIAMYGGGQFELGPGRGQIQYLASLFYPEGSNDVAPRVYNANPPRRELPGSPLIPAPSATGFRWDDGGHDAEATA